MRKTRKGKRSFFISTRLIFWLIFLCCHSSLCRSMVRNAQGQTKKMSQYSVEKNKTTEVSHFQHNRSLSYQTGVSLKGLSLRLTSTHYKNKPWNPWGEGGGGKRTVENYNCSAWLTGGRLQPMGGRSGLWLGADLSPGGCRTHPTPRGVWPTQAGGEPFATVDHVEENGRRKSQRAIRNQEHLPLWRKHPQQLCNMA